MPTCLLIRHGRTTANSSGRLAGWSPGVGLDDLGREQAERLAERLAALPIRRFVTSPLQRCVETTKFLTAHQGDVPMVVEDALGECRYGAWTGGELKELAKDPLWRVVQDQPSAARFPDGDQFPGESLGQMQARAVQAVRAIEAEVEAEHGAGALWVVVSHGDVIKSILADAAGTHLDQFQRIVVDPASLSVVRYTSRRPFVLRVNDCGADLAGLVPPPPPAEGDGAADTAGGEGAADTAEGDAPVGGGAGAAD